MLIVAGVTLYYTVDLATCEIVAFVIGDIILGVYTIVRLTSKNRKGLEPTMSLIRNEGMGFTEIEAGIFNSEGYYEEQKNEIRNRKKIKTFDDIKAKTSKEKVENLGYGAGIAAILSMPEWTEAEVISGSANCCSEVRILSDGIFCSVNYSDGLRLCNEKYKGDIITLPRNTDSGLYHDGKLFCSYNVGCNSLYEKTLEDLEWYLMIILAVFALSVIIKVIIKFQSSEVGSVTIKTISDVEREKSVTRKVFMSNTRAAVLLLLSVSIISFSIACIERANIFKTMNAAALEINGTLECPTSNGMFEKHTNSCMHSYISCAKGVASSQNCGINEAFDGCPNSFDYRTCTSLDDCRLECSCVDGDSKPQNKDSCTVGYLECNRGMWLVKFCNNTENYDPISMSCSNLCSITTTTISTTNIIAETTTTIHESTSAPLENETAYDMLMALPDNRLNSFNKMSVTLVDKSSESVTRGVNRLQAWLTGMKFHPDTITMITSAPNRKAAIIRLLLFIAGKDCSIDLDTAFKGNLVVDCVISDTGKFNIELLNKKVIADKRCIKTEAFVSMYKGVMPCAYKRGKVRVGTKGNRKMAGILLRFKSDIFELELRNNAEESGLMILPTPKGFVTQAHTNTPCTSDLYAWRGGQIYMAEPNSYQGCSDIIDPVTKYWQCGVGRRLLYSCEGNSYGYGPSESTMFYCVSPDVDNTPGFKGGKFKYGVDCRRVQNATVKNDYPSVIPPWRYSHFHDNNGEEVEIICPDRQNTLKKSDFMDAIEYKGAGESTVSGEFVLNSKTKTFVMEARQAIVERHEPDAPANELVSRALVNIPTSSVKIESMFYKTYQDEEQQMGSSKYYVVNGVFKVTEEYTPIKDVKRCRVGTGSWVDCGSTDSHNFFPSDYNPPLVLDYISQSMGSSVEGGYYIFPDDVCPNGGFTNVKDCRTIGSTKYSLYKECATQKTRISGNDIYGENFPKIFSETKVGCGDYRLSSTSCDETTNKQGVIKIDFFNAKNGKPFMRRGRTMLQNSDAFTDHVGYDKQRMSSYTGSSMEGDYSINGWSDERITSNDIKPIKIEYIMVLYYAIRINGPYMGNLNFHGIELTKVAIRDNVCPHANSLKVGGICYTPDMENQNSDVVVGGYPLNANTMVIEGLNENSNSVNPIVFSDPSFTLTNPKGYIRCACSHVFTYVTNHPKVSQFYLAKVSETANIGYYSINGACQLTYHNSTEEDNDQLFCDGDAAIRINIVEYSTFFTRDITQTPQCYLLGNKIKCSSGQSDFYKVLASDSGKGEVLYSYNVTGKEVSIDLVDGVNHLYIGDKTLKVDGGREYKPKYGMITYMEELYVREPVVVVIVGLFLSSGYIIYILYVSAYVLCYFNLYNLRCLLSLCKIIKINRCRFCNLEIEKGEENAHKLCKPRIHTVVKYDTTSKIRNYVQTKGEYSLCPKCVGKSSVSKHIEKPAFSNTVKSKVKINGKKHTAFSEHMFLHEYKRINPLGGRIRMNRTKIIKYFVVLLSLSDLQRLVGAAQVGESELDLGLYENLRGGSFGGSLPVNDTDITCSEAECVMGDVVTTLKLIRGEKITLFHSKEGVRYSESLTVHDVSISTTNELLYIASNFKTQEQRIAWCCSKKDHICSHTSEDVYTGLCDHQGDQAYTAYNLVNPLTSYNCPITHECINPIGRAIWISSGCFFNWGAIAAYSSYSPTITGDVISVFRMTMESVSVTFETEHNGVINVTTSYPITDDGYLNIEGLNQLIQFQTNIGLVSKVGASEPEVIVVDVPGPGDYGGNEFSYRTQWKASGSVCHEGDTMTGATCSIDRSGDAPMYRCNIPEVHISATSISKKYLSLEHRMRCNSEDAIMKWESKEESRTFMGATDSQTYSRPSLSLDLHSCYLGTTSITGLKGLKLKRVEFEGVITSIKCVGEWNRNGMTEMVFHKNIKTDGTVEIECSSTSNNCLLAAGKDKCNVTSSINWKGYCNYKSGSKVEQVYVDCYNLTLGVYDTSGGSSFAFDDSKAQWGGSSLGWVNNPLFWVVIGLIIGAVILLIIPCLYKAGKTAAMKMA